MAVAENRQLAMPADDLLLPFQTVRSGVMGRVVRLGSVVDTILSRHAYPEPVSHALGEALALTAMLGARVKTDGKFILQTKTDGALDFLVADYETPGKLRGYASFDKADARLIEAKGRGDQGLLLGKGHVAMTIDPGGDMDRYQGIVALEGEPLVDAAHTYFRQSEQLPTFIRLAVARHYGPSRAGRRAGLALAAGGILAPASVARRRQADRGRGARRGPRRRR
jgi:molecular chaperone Hsp33